MNVPARKILALAAGVLLAGCAANPPTARAPADDCKAELDRASTQLAAEVAERQRIARAAARREETLKKQLDALKAIERGILEREDRMQSQAR